VLKSPLISELSMAAIIQSFSHPRKPFEI